TKNQWPVRTKQSAEPLRRISRTMPRNNQNTFGDARVKRPDVSGLNAVLGKDLEPFVAQAFYHAVEWQRFSCEEHDRHKLLETSFRSALCRLRSAKSPQ